jgi:hypothetical protein
MKRLTVATALVLGAASPSGSAAGPSRDPQSVLELRQYKIVAGKRDEFIDLFERRFVESQEETGMRLVGQFRDRFDPSRFVWIRSFPSMDLRGKALNDFYFGPVWAAYRNAANPLLDDNDDVLLLKPAWAGSEFAPTTTVRPVPGARAPAASTIVVTIEYLWKNPEQGYASHFRNRLAPAYAAAGLPVLAAYVPENGVNNFPRLVVRQNERLFVWVTRVADVKEYRAALGYLASAGTEGAALVAAQQDYLERKPQILFLSPTPRSLLR